MCQCTLSIGRKSTLIVLGCPSGLFSIFDSMIIKRSTSYLILRYLSKVVITNLSQDFMAGKLPCLPGDYPTLNDWENHLTTIFPEVGIIG